MCLPLASQQCSEKCGESSRETLSKGIANNHKSFVVVQNFKIKKQKKTNTQEFFYSYNIMLKKFGKKKKKHTNHNEQHAKATTRFIQLLFVVLLSLQQMAKVFK